MVMTLKHHSSDFVLQLAMDDLGNRDGAQTVRGGSSVSYAVNPTTNAYTQVGSAVPTYDNAGNMTKDENGYTYHYDYENRIIEVKKTNDTVTVATFDYDASGRRIRKTSYDSVPSVATVYYYNTNWQVLFEKNASDTTQRWYVYGNYIDEPLMLVIPAQAGIYLSRLLTSSDPLSLEFRLIFPFAFSLFPFLYPVYPVNPV